MYAICYIQKLRHIRQNCSQLHQNMWEYFHAIIHTFVDCSWDFLVDQDNIKVLSNTGVNNPRAMAQHQAMACLEAGHKSGRQAPTAPVA